MTVQERNADLIELLNTDFLKRYETNLAWMITCSLLQNTAGLRGLWPMSAVNSTGQAIDQSGIGNHLSYVGSVSYRYSGLYPYANIRGDLGGYLMHADAADFDITGTETYINTKGITIGGWFRPQGPTGSSEHLIGKWTNAAGNYSYQLLRHSGGTIRFYVSVDGTATVYAAGATLSPNVWYFIAGRFSPSAKVDVFVNGAIVINTTAIPASIYSGAAEFTLGLTSGGSSQPYAGDVSLCFLCADYLSDTILHSIYQQSRALFGV